MTKYFLWVPFILALLSCGSDEDSKPSNVITKVTVFDLGDENSSADIKVSVQLSTGHGLSALRVFVVKSDDRSAVTESNAIELPVERYNTIMTDQLSLEFRLKEELLDFNGEEISNGNQYTLMFVVVSGSERHLADKIGFVQLTEEPYLNGAWSGSWNDNLYTNFSITANLTFSDGVLKGPFYYSNNFSSCCGGQNDGEISMSISSGGSLSFKYDQQLVQFMGGACPGKYNGSGTLEEDRLEVNFTGNDCEGPHTGGRIVLSKI